MQLDRLATRLHALRRLQRFFFLQARAPVQRIATDALTRLSKRWPLLFDLLADYGPFRGGGYGYAEAPSSPSTPPRGYAEDSQVLIDKLTRQTHWSARAAAARALGGRADAEAGAALQAALRDSSSEVAVAAAEALAKTYAQGNGFAGLGGAIDEACRCLTIVVENADGFHNPLVRAAAVRALGRIGRDADRNLVHRAVRDTDAEVSVAAIAAIAERDEPAGGEQLVRLLQDRSAFFLPITRLTAARALGRMSNGAGDKLDHLIELEQDPIVHDTLQRMARRD